MYNVLPAHTLTHLTQLSRIHKEFQSPPPKKHLITGLKNDWGLEQWTEWWCCETPCYKLFPGCHQSYCSRQMLQQQVAECTANGP